MTQNITYKVQTCNGNPEVIKVINGHPFDIVKEFINLKDAERACAVMNSIESFKEFSQKEIDPNDYIFQMTDEGFGIIRKDGTPRIGALLANAVNFSEASYNFKWGIYKNFGVEIKCFY